MKFLQRIQNLPETKRKIILWLIVVIIGLALLALYVRGIQKRMRGLEMGELKEELKLPELQEELKTLPKIELPKLEIPEISEEELKKYEPR